MRQIDALREAVSLTGRESPIRIDGWVVLLDQVHRVITLPEGDADLSNRVKALTIRFVRSVPATERRRCAG